MAWLPIALSVVGTVMQVGGALQQAKAAKVAGQQAAINADYQRRQQEQAAGQELAAAQRKALDERHKSQLIASRAMALAGASGGGASDPTVINLLSDLQGEGAFRAGVALYGGEERARLLRQGALTSGYEGTIAQNEASARAGAYRMGALGSIISGGASLYTKYNTPSGGVRPEQAPAPVEDRPVQRYF